jgi:hypothetical protein
VPCNTLIGGVEEGLQLGYFFFEIHLRVASWAGAPFPGLWLLE